MFALNHMAAPTKDHTAVFDLAAALGGGPERRPRRRRGPRAGAVPGQHDRLAGASRCLFLQPPQPSVPLMTAFNIAMFGAGRIGAVHARNIADHDESRLNYVLEREAERARTPAARCGAGVAAVDVVWSDPEVDVLADAADRSLESGRRSSVRN